MDTALGLATGLDDRTRKLVTYYTLATHTLNHVETFPLLVLKGPLGTGKSKTLRVIESFAQGPRMFSLRNRTLPAIRDELAACHDGTAVIEEADQAWKDDELFERMLSDRYQRSSASIAFKEPGRGKGQGFTTVTKFCFGATVLHRRLPFGDPALDSRSVFVRFRADVDRTYEDICDIASWIAEGAALVNGLEFEPVAVVQPAGVAPRTFDAYKPLLSVAQICGDQAFLLQIEELLSFATAELKAGQSVEPDGLVVRALLEKLSSAKRGLDFHNVKFGDLVDSIWYNHRVQLRPQKVGAIVRQLGFATKESHGVTVVMPTLSTILRACEEVGYEDEATIALKKRLVKGVRVSLG